MELKNANVLFDIRVWIISKEKCVWRFVFSIDENNWLVSPFHIFHLSALGWTKPLKSSLFLGTLADLTRSRRELVAENAFLLHQLIILRRHVKRPVSTRQDRSLVVMLTSMVT